MSSLKNTDKNSKNPKVRKYGNSAEKAKTTTPADKTGIDTDKNKSTSREQHEHKFEKLKREFDSNTKGIDLKSDKNSN
jgi:hypothetical protein